MADKEKVEPRFYVSSIPKDHAGNPYQLTTDPEELKQNCNLC
jgi:hypothetical protein